MKQKSEYWIKAAGLSHEYSRRDGDGNVIEIVRAIDDVDMTIHAGQFIAILGANGSGKSTLAKHFNVLLKPTEGTVMIDGKRTDDKENTLAIRQLAGMVFQNPDNQIISNIVEEDVAFGPENMGVPTEKIKKRVWDSLKAVDMFAYRRKSPNHLSGGQKQRVAIAGVLAMESKCIILDEATAMLDPMGRKNVLDNILHLNKEKKITVILITHFMEEVVHADKVFVMNHGKVVLSGTPREVFQAEEILKESKCSLPDAAKIAAGLRKNGVPVREGILTIEELAEEIVRLRMPV